MRRFVVPPAVCALLLSACAQKSTTVDVNDIVAMERAALDRWGKGDPEGYLEIMAPEVTYFDPMQEKRLDGLEAMKRMLAPIVGKVSVSRYEMIDPRVQPHGDAALLTFNLISYQKQPDGSEKAVARWNSTEVYANVDGQWRIIHSHWSFIKPVLKDAVTEEAGLTPVRSWLSTRSRLLM
jgi:uncharacterized protein (TIGR02246 family)